MSFRTSEYPAFPTDMQAQFMALDCIAEGTSTHRRDDLREPLHARATRCCGSVRTSRSTASVAVIQGVEKLSGATVMATDLRASASLVIAGLVAEGETVVDRIYHLDRGYDRMEAKLRSLGADIERVERMRPATQEPEQGRSRWHRQGPHLRRDAAAAGRGRHRRHRRSGEVSRKLILATNQPDVRVVLVRATDVPTYVQHGGADLGVAGKDACSSTAARACTSRSTCGIARCRMSVAARADFDYAAAVKQGSRIRVATKYIAIARDHFADKGVHVDLIKLYGSMELAPLTGLADAIVDLVSTGNTLKANDARRSRAHHGHLVAAGRQPGGAEAQARAASAR